ncbi:MAG: GNAT family N-acetyltransferase [Lachnospiraceae bacterium]|nr:GNAT family N-acetyltransferase [Lachnospiraceae bacterium]
MHRLYANDDISVFWDSDKCFHAKKCVAGCPEAFDITRKPWINIDNAPTAKVWQAVSECPSGALTCTYNHDVTVKYDENGCCSAAFCNDKIIGRCEYEAASDGWVIYHTEVDPEYGGRGIAKRLVYAIVEQADRNGVKVIPTCSYARKVLNGN